MFFAMTWDNIIGSQPYFCPVSYRQAQAWLFKIGVPILSPTPAQTTPSHPSSPSRMPPRQPRPHTSRHQYLASLHLRGIRRWSRRAFRKGVPATFYALPLATVAALLLLLFRARAGAHGGQPWRPRAFLAGGGGVWGARRDSVANATRHAFEGYRRSAWGFDELLPVTGGGVDNFNPPHGLGGLTIVDSLDTLAVMGLSDLVAEAVQWIGEGGLNLEGAGVVGCFETVIRIVGGLVSAYQLTGEGVLLEKAVAVAEPIAGCFLRRDRPPFPQVHVGKRECRDNPWGATVPAAINLVMEWRVLAEESGKPIFREVVRAQEEVLKEMQARSFGGLVGSDVPQREFVEPSRHSRAGIGSPSDSYYEYFIKSHLATRGRGEGRSTKWETYWKEIADTVVDVLAVAVPGMGMVTTHARKAEVDERRRVKMPTETSGERIVFDHFSCYLPGLLYLTVHIAPPRGEPGCLSTERERAYLSTARGLTEACSRMYDTPSGLSGEATRIVSADKIFHVGEYNLRPEVVEALFYESRLAPEQGVRQRARERAWKIFEAIEKHSKTQHGYAAIANPADEKALSSADGFVQRNSQPSFLIAETFKYLYLIFSDAAAGDSGKRLLDLDEYVFSTECHPFRIRMPAGQVPG